MDDISTDQRAAAKHAKDAGSAAVAITAIATGVAWAVIIFDLLSGLTIHINYFCRINGAVDGARTRDPRRDRPVL